MANLKYAQISSDVDVNSSLILFLSLLELAWMCLRATRSWVPGKTGWRRRSAKSCSTRLTSWSWTSRAFRRSCRVISWRCSNRGFRSCSAEGRTGLSVDLPRVTMKTPPYQNICNKCAVLSPLCAKKIKIKQSPLEYFFFPFCSSVLHQELFMHAMQALQSCSGVAAAQNHIPAQHNQLWNRCFPVGQCVQTAHFPLCSAGNSKRVFIAKIKKIFQNNARFASQSCSNGPFRKQTSQNEGHSVAHMVCLIHVLGCITRMHKKNKK